MLNKTLHIVPILKAGGVGILATDTIYGLVGRALNKKTVARIYRVKKRTPTKPLIVLISSPSDLKKFGIRLNFSTRQLLNSFWPGKVSVILPCASAKFQYLHRGTKTLAFRLPKNYRLRAILKETGPLVAPSANPEGLPPARTILVAKKYFGNEADFYVNAGRRVGKPSMLVSIKNVKMIRLRN